MSLQDTSVRSSACFDQFAGQHLHGVHLTLPKVTLKTCPICFFPAILLRQAAFCSLCLPPAMGSVILETKSWKLQTLPFFRRLPSTHHLPRLAFFFSPSICSHIKSLWQSEHRYLTDHPVLNMYIISLGNEIRVTVLGWHVQQGDVVIPTVPTLKTCLQDW